MLFKNKSSEVQYDGNRKSFAVSNDTKDIINVENDPSLLDEPSDILRLIGSRLDIESAGSLVKNRRTINIFFQPDLTKEAESFVAQALAFCCLW